MGSKRLRIGQGISMNTPPKIDDKELADRIALVMGFTLVACVGVFFLCIYLM